MLIGLLPLACASATPATGRRVDGSSDDSVAPPIRVATPPAEPVADGPPPRRIDELMLEPRPAWMDKYAAPDVEPPVFLSIDRVMVKFGLDRASAIEVQNHVRDGLRQGAIGAERGLEVALEQALDAVKAGQFEAYSTASVGAAKFVVAVDLDETLIDQYLRAPVPTGKGACESVTTTLGENPARSVLRPGLANFVRGVAARGGVLVVFSANTDDNVLSHASAITVDGKSLREHPAVAGVLSNSHLILQDRDVVDAQGATRRGKPVIEPSKDLRYIDETLAKVILVDDNPHRVFQLRNLRVIDKLDGDRVCAAMPRTDPTGKVPPAVVDPGADAMGRSFTTILAEIDDALAYMDKHKVSFAQAYLPYTVLGSVTVESLRQGGKLSDKAARDLVRSHPEWVPEDF